jgi:hypothetical protein
MCCSLLPKRRKGRLRINIMETKFTGNKEKFAIEYWSDPEHILWGSFCVWFLNNKIGELSEETYTHLGALDAILKGIIENKERLFDIGFVGISDNQIFNIIYDAILNYDLYESQSDEEIHSLSLRYGKFISFGEIPFDFDCIFSLYYSELKQFKFLIKNDSVGKLQTYSIDESEFVKVANEYSAYVESLRAVTRKI